jgi:hypothetical protein
MGRIDSASVPIGYRQLVAASQFLTDTLSNTGQTYEGKVWRTDEAGFTVSDSGSPQTVFNTIANAQNDNNAGSGGADLAVYIGGSDVAHLTNLGSRYRAAALRAAATL